MKPRLGIGINYWNDMKAPDWPDFEVLIKMDWRELTKDQQCRHWYEPSYHPSLLPVLRHKFPGIEILNTSYSQALQDIFILTFLNGKTNGTYLEIGCGDPTFGTNSYTLEKYYGWTGISIDCAKYLKPLWQQRRPNSTFIIEDAFGIDYNQLIQQYNLPSQIDFLQTDVDSGGMDVELLERVLLTRRRFSVIMFEHNLYLGSDQEKNQSTKLLEKFGYQKVVDNIIHKEFDREKFVAFEDWWVDPTVVDKNIIDKFITLGKEMVHPLDLLCEPGSIEHLMAPVWKQKNIWKQKNVR